MFRRAGIALSIVALAAVTLFILGNFQKAKNERDTVRPPQTASQVGEQTLEGVNLLEQPTKSASAEPSKNESDYVVACEYQFDEEVFELRKFGPLISDEDELNQRWKDSDDSFAHLAYFLSTIEADSDIGSENILSSISKTDSLGGKKLLAQSFAKECGTNKDISTCLNTSEDLISKYDSSNGASWFSLASLHSKIGDKEKVIVALNNIISSPEYNDYWGEMVETYDKAYSSIGLVEKQARVFAAIGMAAAKVLPSVSPLFKFCKEQSKNRADIAQLCIDAGRRIESGSKISVGQAIGFALQKTVYDALGLKNESDRVEIELLKSRTSINWYSIEPLMYKDEELFGYWYHSMLQLGEIEAQRLVYLEAVRKSKDPNYDPCESKLK